MEAAVRLFATIHFTAIGLSHILQHRAWAEFFIALRERGRLGSFVNGFITLGVGSIIVAFHNVWSGLPVVLTIVGWGQVAKGFVCLLFPDQAVASLSHVTLERSRRFMAAGVLMLALSALLVWTLVRD